MRIIDLFNKKVNDEELPLKIEYQGYIFEQNFENEYETDGVPLLSFINLNLSNLDDEIKLLEDETIDIDNIEEFNISDEYTSAIINEDNIYMLFKTQNEIIKAVKQLNNEMKSIKENE